MYDRRRSAGRKAHKTVRYEHLNKVLNRKQKYLYSLEMASNR